MVCPYVLYLSENSHAFSIDLCQPPKMLHIVSFKIRSKLVLDVTRTQQGHFEVQKGLFLLNFTLI